MIGFLLRGRGRRATPWLHKLLHPGVPGNGWRFAQVGGCVLCRAAWRDVEKSLPPQFWDSFEDQSLVPVEGIEMPEGKRMVMSATVKRQIDAIIAADPAVADELREALEGIAKDVWKDEK